MRHCYRERRTSLMIPGVDMSTQYPVLLRNAAEDFEAGINLINGADDFQINAYIQGVSIWNDPASVIKNHVTPTRITFTVANDRVAISVNGGTGQEAASSDQLDF